MPSSPSRLIPAVIMTMAAAGLHCPSPARAAFATTVVDWQPGAGVTLRNPYGAVGRPAGMVSPDSPIAAALSPFNPHFEDSHLAQIGEGGSLTLKLERPAEIVPGQPEIGVFTNAGLGDTDFPNGQTANDLGSPFATFGIDCAEVDVSEDGITWAGLGKRSFELPTTAFTDAGSPFETDIAGLTPADFGLPHSRTLTDFQNQTWAGVQSLLGASAGGTWLDLDATGLPRIVYVRFRLEDDGDPATALTFEVDAVSINDSATGPPLAPEGILLDEDFAGADPIGSRAMVEGDSAHFEFDDASNRLVTHFDVSGPSARLRWPLDASLNESTPFTVTVDLEFVEVNFPGFNACQLSFGLINRESTGTRRTSAPSDAWNLFTVDYFPGPDLTTLTPTVIPGEAESNDALSAIEFPAGSESLINEPGESGPLPENRRLTISLDYAPASRLVTLRVMAGGGTEHPVINAFGPDPDGDVSTIQHTLTPGAAFDLDSFAILNWEHGDGGSAEVAFHRISVRSGLARDHYFDWADDSIPGPAIDRGPQEDADGDGLGNLLEYAFGLDPAVPSRAGAPRMERSPARFQYQVHTSRPDVQVDLEKSMDAIHWIPGSSTMRSTSGNIEFREAAPGGGGSSQYLRLKVTRPGP